METIVKKLKDLEIGDRFEGYGEICRVHHHDSSTNLTYFKFTVVTGGFTRPSGYYCQRALHSRFESIDSDSVVDALTWDCSQ